MKKEEIIDEAYLNYLQYTILGVINGLDRIAGHLDNCLVEYEGYYEHFNNPSFAYGFRPHTVEEFIDRCKTNPEFSEKWGLKIEERELSLKERTKYKKERGDRIARTFAAYTHQMLDNANIPTRLITLTYNNETIESYE